MRKLCRQIKVERESNAMRHSFGSYHFALKGDSKETARLLGHKVNDTVLFDHYRAMTTKAKAETYFNMFPAGSGESIASSPSASTS